MIVQQPERERGLQVRRSSLSAHVARLRASLFLGVCCSMASEPSGAASPLGTLREHNPSNATVTKIHMVLSSHLDFGAKTPGCGRTRAGEPLRCARVIPNLPKHPGGMGEPWAFQIINRHFDEFVPAAIANAGAGVSFMIQPWIVSVYLDCSKAGMLFWPELGHGFTAGVSSLHCPNSSSVAALRTALKRGDIVLHAFAHNAEASTYPDASLFEAGIEVGERLADELGIARPTVVSQRDVPGWTRATLPLLNKHGIHGLSFGAGTPPGKVDVPPLCVWRDVASNAEVVLAYETAYGTTATVFVLSTGEALVAAWAGDNTALPSVADVQGFFATLKGRYPDAEIVTSTFDAFFAVANRPEVKATLPVITTEIEDAWIHGVPADPLKNALLREASRHRLACLESGACSKDSSAMHAFERLLIKAPEHTAGVAHVWFLPDDENYTNPQFDRARAQQPLGFVADNRKHADYNSTVNSWIEQRAFVTQAPLLLKEEYPELAANISDALAALQAVEPVPSLVGLAPAALDVPFACGSSGLALQVGPGGGIVSLKRGERQWASPTHPVGQFLYETYVEADFTAFLQDLGARIGDSGVWPEHTIGPYAPFANTTRTCADDVSFCKAGMSTAHPKRRSIFPTVTNIWTGTGLGLEGGGCVVVINSTFPAEAHTTAGAPAGVVTRLTVSSDGKTLDWDVVQVNKRPTRLAESVFFTFNPVVSDPRRWGLTVLGSKMDPLDVLGKLIEGRDPRATYLDSVYGGSPHLRGVDDAHYTESDGHGGSDGVGFELTSMDVPVMCAGKATPFPTPRTGPPDMAHGVSWNIYQNMWNTNYVQWYPFRKADRHVRSRFRMRFL